jgi:hypothetical protein
MVSQLINPSLALMEIPFNPEFQDRIDWASNQIEIHVLRDGTRIVTGYGQWLNDELEVEEDD